MSDFNAYEFVADHAGMDIFEALSSAYQQGRADGKAEGITDFALKAIQAYYDGTLDECEIHRIERMLKGA